jgi:hypothetical protein
MDKLSSIIAYSNNFRLLMGVYSKNLMHNNPKFEKGGMDYLLGDLV